MSPPRRLRSDRLAIVTTVVCLVIASAVYYVIQRGKLGDTRLATDKTLLAALAATIVVIAVAIGWMTVRNLARVLAGRRSPVGSRLQARVAVAFLALVFVPSLVLFGSAIAIVRQSLQQLSRSENVQVLREAAVVPDWIHEDRMRRARHVARVVARELSGERPLDGRRTGRSALARWLGERLERYDVAAVGVLRADAPPLSVASTREEDDVRVAELTRVPAELVAQVRATRRGAAISERMPVGWRAVALEPVPGTGEEPTVVFVTVYLPETIEDLLGHVSAAFRDVQSFEQRRVPVERLYYSLFALITLVVLFAAVWTGFFLARQVTRPIDELARGTEALAQGDLGFRVREYGDDEIGRLARSFNRMAEEVQRHRRDLVARRRYIETLLEAIPVGVLSVDESGRISTVNRAARAVLRLDELPVGRPVSEALGPGRREVARFVEAALADAGQESRSEELTIATEAGDVSILVRTEPFTLPARGGGVLVVLEDLTQLRRAERLAAWSEVARRVAHEIKNPLTPIRLAAERMVRRFERDPERFREVLEDGVRTIVREVESLRELVAEFSRFARMPATHLEHGDARKVAAEAVELFRAAHAEVHLDTEFAPRLPPHRVDHEALRRCLINLLDNAVAAAGERGSIEVRVVPGAAGRSVVIEVIDDGPGIPAEDRQRLFEPEFSRRAGGTGLGLAIVMQIVTEHHGTIRAEDAPRGGTRIVIELPAVDRPAGDLAAADEGRPVPPAREG
ncbi:MAG: ATP-binding protein [Acidobacteriota bacterium]